MRPTLSSEVKKNLERVLNVTARLWALPSAKENLDPMAHEDPARGQSTFNQSPSAHA